MLYYNTSRGAVDVYKRQLTSKCNIYALIVARVNQKRTDCGQGSNNSQENGSRKVLVPRMGILYLCITYFVQHNKCCMSLKISSNKYVRA